jgi:DNA-binding transcriptional LysR family regulator
MCWGRCSGHRVLAALQEGASGLLRVGVDHGRASAVLGERVLRFCARHPDMRRGDRRRRRPHLVQELLAGSLDLVLCRRPQPLPPSCTLKPLRPDEAVVVAGPGIPWPGAKA